MPAKTLAQFRTQIAAKLSLDVDDADELDLIDGWINDGVEYVVGETGCKVAIATMTATANEGDYELDTDILRILWLQSSATGTSSEWEPTSPSEILRLRLNGSASSPTLRYAVDGANMLMLYPVPASADTITIRYVPRPATLSSDAADTPSRSPASSTGSSRSTRSGRAATTTTTRPARRAPVTTSSSRKGSST
jgi:hypothetical protein